MCSGQPCLSSAFLGTVEKKKEEKEQAVLPSGEGEPARPAGSPLEPGRASGSARLELKTLARELGKLKFSLEFS